MCMGCQGTPDSVTALLVVSACRSFTAVCTCSLPLWFCFSVLCTAAETQSVYLLDLFGWLLIYEQILWSILDLTGHTGDLRYPYKA